MPDVLDVVVILEHVEHLLHALDVALVGELYIGLRDHLDLGGEQLVAVAREVFRNGGDVVRLGVDGEHVAIGLHVRGAGLQGILHDLILIEVAVLIIDDDNALAVKAPGDAAGRAHVAVVLVESVPHVGGCAVAVIAHGLDDYGDTAGAVALIGDGLVVIGIAAAERLFDGALYIVVGHVRGLGLGYDGGEAGVIRGVPASALLDGDYHLSGYLGEGLRALSVLSALGFLYVVPLGMS